MVLSRRKFFNKSLLGAGGFIVSDISIGKNIYKKMNTDQEIRPKVIFFDVNETLLDLAPLKEQLTGILNGQKELVALWFTTMLQYSLVGTVSDQYKDFGEIGVATLLMVARNYDISISEAKAKEILKGIRSLPAHSEVPEALKKLKNEGYTLATLTNSSNAAVEEQMVNSGLKQYFSKLLSIEDIGMYKPHKNTYQWAARKMGINPEESLLVAAHGWDVAGAKWAGMKTAFISRPGQQLYPHAKKPDLIAPTLTEIADALVSIRK
ncbi:haloacid dehalogenase type II [soil metagenome]